MLIIATIITLVIFIQGLYKYLGYRRTILRYCSNEWTKMKWSMVKQLYVVNPEKWRFDTQEHSRYSSWKPVLYYKERVGYYSYKYIFVLLSFFDYQRLRLANVRYKIKKKIERNNKKKLECNKNLEIILNGVQQDIDQLKQKANADIEKASKDYVKIVERMGKND